MEAFQSGGKQFQTDNLLCISYRSKILFLWTVLTAVLCVGAAISIAVGMRNGMRFIDFQWNPVKILVSGENPYQYSLTETTFDSYQVDANQVPSCLLLLTPLTFFPRMIANEIWCYLNILFSATFLFFTYKILEMKRNNAWYRSLTPATWIFISALFFSGTPWRVLIGNGQHLMFSLAFFMAAIYFANKKQTCLAGVLIAISLFKYTTIAPMLFIFVMQKQFKPLIIAASIHIAATLGVGIYLHENPIMMILDSFKVGNKLAGVGDADFGSLARAFQMGNWRFFALIGYVVSVVIILWQSLCNKGNNLLKLCILAILSNMMFYHRVYDFVTLIFPLIYVLSQKNDTRFKRFEFLIIAINIGYVFFAARFLFSLGNKGVISISTPIAIATTFLLQFILLVTLMLDAKTENSSKSTSIEI